MAHFICMMLFSFSLHGRSAIAQYDSLASLRPVATADEQAAFQKYAGDETSAYQFVETRKYMRLIGYPGKLNAGVAPPVPDAVQFKYALNFSEQLQLFNIMLAQGITRGLDS